MSFERCGSNIWRTRTQCRASEEQRWEKRCDSKPVLLSRPELDQLQHLPSQRDSASLIAQIVAAQQDLPIREFTSYFRGTAKYNSPCLITSHTKKRRPIVPVYPSLLQQTLKWNPFEAAPSISQDYLPEVPRERKNECHCKECTSPHCPGRRNSVSDLKQFLFKDNIIQFCDQSTMTPQSTDAACGICLGVTPTRNTDISAEISQSADYDSAPFNNPLNSSRPRTPILRRTAAECINNIEPRKQRHMCDDYDDCYKPQRARKVYYNTSHEPVRDIDPSESYHEIYQPKSKAQLHGVCDMINDDGKQHVTRRNLYNEGISDSTVTKFPQCATRKLSPLELTTPTGVSVSKCYINCIPFSHRRNSKYHDDCKRPPDQVYYRAAAEDPRGCSECPRHQVRVQHKKPCSPRPVCINLPKKMLTSEKNIDAFIINGQKYYRANEDDYWCNK